ncbi:hypothetical protein BGZ94_009141 [Podila epigama]|nr:hypothetical protein BGZ94_009141 [Podila epigama]
MVKDLASLALATGQPLTGTKSVLVKRISHCLASIMKQIDSAVEQQPHLTDSICSSAATTTDRRAASTMEHLKRSLMPSSIVSIDVGIRNFAWVEVSSQGEILRWSVEDLLADENPGVHNPSCASLSEKQERTSQVSTPRQQEQQQAQVLSSQESNPSHETTRSKVKRKAKKPPAPLYDPRTMALRLDQVMRRIFGRGNNIEGVIIERQRFRTAGMHAVLDSTFKCGVLEGMIYTWLTFWDMSGDRFREPVTMSTTTTSMTHAIQLKKNRPFFIESVSPRAVASWWGIGSSPLSSSSSSILKNGINTTVNSDEPVSIVDMIADDIHVDTDVATESKQRKAKAPKYAAKKGQARRIVDGWIQGQHSLDDEKMTERRHSLQVSCSPAVREWYQLEKKRDDLSDCLLQAVAWLEWREQAIHEAITRYPSKMKS